MMILNPYRFAATAGFPVVQSVTSSSFAADTNAHAAAMPATVNAGEMLLAFVSARVTSGGFTTATPSGWTHIVTGNPGSQAETRHALYRRTADGSEGGTTVDFATSVAAHAAIQVWRISGGASLAFNTVTSISSNTTPNPPNLASGFTGNLLWIAGFGSNGTAAPTAWPTGFAGNQTTTASGGANLCRAITCSKNDSSGTLDPDAFTMAATTHFHGFTIAVSP